MYNLLGHMHLHAGSKPFKCPYCSSKFNLKGNLSRHMKVKHGMDISPDGQDALPGMEGQGHYEEDNFDFGTSGQTTTWIMEAPRTSPSSPRPTWTTWTTITTLGRIQLTTTRLEQQENSVNGLQTIRHHGLMEKRPWVIGGLTADHGLLVD
ncbi:zinc finger protein 398-like [Oncorhynchus nerka]|uniref:zinc finger protein 398-like n=1 Tax=Oncorhynchus nerka TaxID=8023 RepID=UPI0031B80AA1